MKYVSIIAILVFACLAASPAFAANPGHSASSVSAGTFESGNFIFPNNLQVNQNMSIGTSSSLARLHINGTGSLLNITNGTKTLIYTNETTVSITNSVDNLLSTSLAIQLVRNPSTGGSENVFVSYPYLYKSGDYNLSIWDISNPYLPIKLGSTYSNGSRSLYVSGKYAYGVSYSGGWFEIFDVSDTWNPRRIYYNQTGGMAQPESLVASGPYVYANLLYKGLKIWDVADPYNPILKNPSTTVANVGYGYLDVQGKYAYSAGRGDNCQNDNSGKFMITDVSNPSSPVDMNTTNPRTGACLGPIDVEGSYLYLGDTGFNVTYIYNITNASSPTLLSNITLTSYPYSLRVYGRYLFVSTAILEVYDVSNPASPVLVGNSTQTTTSGYGMFVSGPYLYVAYTYSNLRIFKIPGIETASLRAHSADMGTLAVSGNAYIGDSLNVRTGLTVGSGGIWSQGDVGITKNLTVFGIVNASGFANITAPRINKVIVVDGVNYAQSSAGIQAAIDALPSTGGEVFLPEATYNITSQIIINKSSITLKGVGGGTLLRLANSVNSGVSVIVKNSTIQNVYNMVLEDFAIDGNSANQTSGTQYGVYTYGGIYDSRINRLLIRNMRNDSIYLRYDFSGGGHFINGIISNCLLEGNNGSGIYAEYVQGASFINNKIRNNAIDGITVGTATSGSVITGNLIESNGDDGIEGSGGETNGWRSLLISDNTIKSNGDYGIGFTSYSNIINNEISFSGGYGIRAEDYVTISGNHIISNIGPGIGFWGLGDGLAQNNIVTGNFLYSNANASSSSSIEIHTHSRNTTVSGNIIIDTAGTGSAIYVHPGAVNTVLTGNFYGGTGATKIDDTSPTTRYLQQNRISIALNDSDYGGAVTALTANQSGTGKIMELINGTSPVFSVPVNGNVGIGTTSPQAKLSVNRTGTASGELLRIGNETNTFLYVNGTEAFTSITGDVQNLLNTSPGLRFANIIPYPSAGSYAVYDTVIAGKYLYAIVQVLGESSYRFMIYDISNPHLPVSVGNITSNTAIANPGTIYISGRYAYLGGGVNFTIVDISNPSSPSIVSTTYTASLNVDHSTGFGHYVVLYGIYDAGIYDVLDPTSPRRVSTLTTWGWNRLYVSGNYLYIAAHGGGSCATDGRFAIYDITNPVSPTLVNVTTTIDCPEEIFVSGNYAFLASRGNVIDIYNISNQSKPTLVRNISLSGSAGWYIYGIFVTGRYLYTLSDRIDIFDISNINSPVKVWTSSAIHSQGARIRVSGKYLITAPANGEARIYEIPGIETTALNAHSAEVGSLFVSGDVYIDNRLSVRTDLRVGSGGFMCQGDAGFQKNLSVLGSVGIGTTTPSEKLNVNGSFRVDNSTGSAVLFVNATSNKVGIGTSGPGAQFQVYNSTSSADIDLAIFGTPTEEVKIYTKGGEGGIGTRTADGFSLFVDNVTTRGMYIQSSTGYVGIGTQGPTVPLQLAGPIKIGSSPNIYTFNESNGLMQFTGERPGYVRFSFVDNGTSRLYIGTGGNVGIATTSPTANLSVNGNISFGSMAVQANKALCWTGDKSIGYCSSVVASDGTCTCNAIT